MTLLLELPVHAVPPPGVDASSRVRRAVTAATLAGAALGAAAVAVALPWHRFLALKAIALISLGTGSFVVLSPVLEPSIPFSPLQIATLVFVMDAVAAVLVAANVGRLFRLPWIGRILGEAEDAGRRLLETRPWVRRAAMLAVFGLVASPLPGTGAIGGTMLGRMAGLGLLRVLAAILLGSFAGSFGLGLFAEGAAAALAPVQDSAWFRFAGWGGAAVVAAAIFLAPRISRKGVNL